MLGILAVPVGAAVAWLLTPVVDMAVRGTIDSRTVASWREEPVRRAPADVTIPGPRAAADQTMGSVTSV